MSNEKEISEEIVRRVFEQLNLSIQNIDPSNSETPDFKVSIGNEVAYIEVKEKQEARDLRNKRQQALNAGKMHISTNTIEPNNTISGVFRKAGSQLSAFNDGLRIAWFHSKTFYPNATDQQAFDTLSGGQRLVSQERSGVLYCKFFHDSVFYREQASIDVAITSMNNRGKLDVRVYPNPFSAHTDKIEGSRILAEMGYRPISQESPPSILVLDVDCDRGSVEAKVAALKAKYNLRTLELFNVGAMQMYSEL